MKYNVNISFDKESIDGTDFKKFINYFLHFKPLSFSNRKFKGFEWDESKVEKELLKCNKDDYFSISNDDTGELFQTCLAVGEKERYRSISLEQNEFEINDSELFNFINRDGFISCFLCNADYVNQQSAERGSDYRILGIPIELSMGIPFEYDDIGAKVFDISGNIGRVQIIREKEVTPAYKMWLGEPFFEIIPRNDLLAIDFATKVEELENDIIFIQLFDDIDSPRSEENIGRQRKFMSLIKG